MCAKCDIQDNKKTIGQKTAAVKERSGASSSKSASVNTDERTFQASNNDTVFVAKSMTLREDQYMDITSLAAYNKLLRRKPDSVSAVVREALDQYLSSTDDSYRYIGK